MDFKKTAKMMAAKKERKRKTKEIKRNVLSSEEIIIS